MSYAMYVEKDKLDMLIELAPLAGDDEVELFNSIDTSDVVLDRRYYRMRNRIIRKYKYGPMIKSAARVMSKVAVIIMMILSLSFVTVLAAPNLRRALFDAVIEWYNEYIAVWYVSADDSVNAEAVPTYIEEYRKPRYIPDGVVEDVVWEGNNAHSIDYYIDGNVVYTFYQRVLSTDNINYYNNNLYETKTFEINGCNATLVQRADRSKTVILWSDGRYSYELCSSIYSIEELIIIAESVE